MKETADEVAILYLCGAGGSGSTSSGGSSGLITVMGSINAFCPTHAPPHPRPVCGGSGSPRRQGTGCTAKPPGGGGGGGRAAIMASVSHTCLSHRTPLQDKRHRADRASHSAGVLLVHTPRTAIREPEGSSHHSAQIQHLQVLSSARTTKTKQ